MTGEVERTEEAEEPDGAEDSRSVAISSNMGLAGSVQAALTLTTYLWARMILANDQKKRPNSDKPKPITHHGKD